MKIRIGSKCKHCGNKMRRIATGNGWDHVGPAMRHYPEPRYVRISERWLWLVVALALALAWLTGCKPSPDSTYRISMPGTDAVWTHVKCPEYYGNSIRFQDERGRWIVLSNYIEEQE